MLYTALGDSITYGYCSTHPDHRYVARLQHYVNAGKQPMNLYVHARPGWTSKQLLRTLNRVPDSLWDETRLITIMLGGNDLLRATPFLLDGNPARMVRVAERLHNNINAIIDKVQRTDTVVVLGTLYNPFPNSPIVERCTQALNRAIRCAAERERTVLADVEEVFKPRVHQCIDGYRNGLMRDFRIKGNPIHPNDIGHDVIAKAFLKAYRSAVTEFRELRRNHP